MRISPFGDFIEFGDFTDSLRVDIQSCGDASYPGSWSFQVISCHTWCQFLGCKSNRIKDTSGIIKPTEFGSRRDRLHSGRVYIVHDLEFMALTWAPAGIARAHLCRVHFCSELLTDGLAQCLARLSRAAVRASVSSWLQDRIKSTEVLSEQVLQWESLKD